jgi:hypothetical protein
VVRGKFLAVGRCRAAAEQRRRPGVVQVNVVQHDQPGEAEQVWPLEVVVRRVAHLVDGEVVGSLMVPPEELVSRAGARDERNGGLVDEKVDVMVGPQAGDEIGAAGRDPGAHGRHRAEPGESGHG